MGKKMENIRRISNEGKREISRASELSKKATDDVKRQVFELDSLSGDFDDEIIEAVKEERKQIKEDAEDYFDTVVSEKINEGNTRLNESTDNAKGQIDNNNNVIETFKQMDSVGGFGKKGRDIGTKKIEDITNSFVDMISDNNDVAKEAEKDFLRWKREISNL